MTYFQFTAAAGHFYSSRLSIVRDERRFTRHPTTFPLPRSILPPRPGTRGETRDLLILLPAADRIYEFSPAPCQQHSAVETSWFGELDEHRSLARSIFRLLNRRRFCEPTLACHSPFLRDRAAFRSRKDIYHTLDTRQLSVAPISLPDQLEQREKEREGGRGWPVEEGEYGRVGNSFCPRYANISASIDTLRLPSYYVTPRKNVPSHLSLSPSRS